MANTINFQGKPFHFIGIGGIGMSALAYILAKRNLPVSGSDIRSTHITQRLESAGAHIFSRQDADNLDFFKMPTEDHPAPITIGVGVEGNGNNGGYGATQVQDSNPPQVICSTAIQANNAEYQAAQAQGYPIFHRSDVLAALIEDYDSIAVAGTHGKTTTSSLIGYVLLQGGLDPTIVIGGEVNAIGGNARLGQGGYLVAEADESDGSLVKLAAKIGVVTNIELDHPDHYDSLDEVTEIFRIFEQQCETMVACWDCATVRSTLRPQITYSLFPEQGADYTVTDVVYSAEGTTAQVWEKDVLLGSLHLPLLGQHNLSNTLAAIAVARHLGLSFPVIAQGISTFEGAKRRFEYRGQANGITFVDDYAHHPSEVQATLGAARLLVQQNAQSQGAYRRLVAVFQPHRYSRTQAFLGDFAQSFQDADLVIVTDIYSAGESPVGQLGGEQVADAIAHYHPQVIYGGGLEPVTALLEEMLQPGDLTLFLGAGNLNQIIPHLLVFYSKVSLPTSV
ncbi:UDP-N-acetylmuramate--L-alanine ligase [Spirulina subsalsa FACHB-351]|uniref:UDP-N-acetylmuramate--L-alanine ligase n=1 Tax=Spirulina subsalsa FACHB-351 TaxID=234711 RepID=A0ABT3LAU4_9CYAN|nr:UDP-N-acetylmuramate--L-alanine ligase [Spirulina subsalsa]MCW6038232.1 UDP-N-acetylmuramate--L-alanine ligase [Spirulina subsalsa FACHB-351]